MHHYNLNIHYYKCILLSLNDKKILRDNTQNILKALKNTHLVLTLPEYLFFSLHRVI